MIIKNEKKNIYYLHLLSESEWVPVPPKKVEPQKKFVPASEPLCSLPKPVPVPAPVPPPAPVAASVPTSVPTTVSQPSVFPQNMSAEVSNQFSYLLLISINILIHYQLII